MTHWSDEYAKLDAVDTDQQVTDDDMLKVVHEDDRERVKKIYDDANEKRHSYDVDFRIVDPDGTIRWLYEFAEVEYDDVGREIAHFGVIQDITGRKELEQKLFSLSQTDHLTGLLNRREFDAQLEKTLARNARTESRTALLFIDMDGFKKVNDELGHDAGDEVLKEIAIRLKQQIRKTDVAGRMGGDEFTVILESDVSLDGMITIIERILVALAEPYHLLNEKVAHLSGSIGVSVAPDDAENMTELYKIADVAMYEAKNMGKNRYILGKAVPEA